MFCTYKHVYIMMLRSLQAIPHEIPSLQQNLLIFPLPVLFPTPALDLIRLFI